MPSETVHSSMSPAAELEQYRSVSVLAVISLVVGFLSVVALAYPALWLVPVIGLLLGIAGVYRTTVNADLLSGKLLASLGVCLAVFFGAWAPAQYFSSRRIVDAQSQEFCTAWLRLVLRGELEAAHQAHLNYRFRQPVSSSVVEHYRSNDQDRRDLEDFFAVGVIKDIRGLPENAVIAHTGTRGFELRRDKSEVIHSFELSRGVDSSDPPIRVRMHVEREKRNGIVFWTLIGIADDAAFASGN